MYDDKGEVIRESLMRVYGMLILPVLELFYLKKLMEMSR